MAPFIITYDVPCPFKQIPRRPGNEGLESPDVKSTDTGALVLFPIVGSLHHGSTLPGPLQLTGASWLDSMYLGRHVFLYHDVGPYINTHQGKMYIQNVMSLQSRIFVVICLNRWIHLFLYM